MTPIVKTITRLILGFIVVFSASVILYGHITPGGGFAGGSMLACGFVLLLLAFGKEGSRA
ncbi:MAG: MnhB domain-containing protein, partial [Planctomycetes bacterium]|nr:MnhB domain-containing protein [Planctomycetota bacterium]